MVEKIPPEETEKQNHAYMLVGRFMSHWSHLESAVNDIHELRTSSNSERA